LEKIIVGRQVDKSFCALKAMNTAKRELLKAQRSAGHMNAVSIFHSDYARTLVEEANTLLTPPEPVKITIGGEALPALENRMLDGVREAMLDPDTIALDASASRLELLADADSVALGIDTAQSINAKNALERMLAHQLAASHRQALRLMARIDRVDDNLEKLRLSNACARLMQIFQDGIRLIDKIRTGGRQLVVVQHVRVSDGGQAVIAGKVQTRGAKLKEGYVKKLETASRKARR
jgi:hypothetical protein